MVLTLVLHMVVPAVYYGVVTGGLTVTKGTGFVLAITAEVLLIL